MRKSSWTLAVALGCSSDQALTGTDSVRPSLEITSPERGSWQSEGITILTGEVRSIRRILVNGEAFDVDEGPFSIPVDLERGIQYLEVQGLGMDSRMIFDRRAVIAGEFAEADGTIEDALGVRINEGGLEDTAEIISEAVDQQGINRDIASMNPVVELEYGWGTDVALDLENIYFNKPIIDIDAEDHQFELEITLPNLFVDTEAHTRVLWVESDHELEIVADNAVIDIDLELWAHQGVVQVEPTKTDVRLEGFEYDISLLPGEIVENHVFEDTVREAIEDNLAESMESMLPEILIDLQQDLEIAFEVELLGTQMHVEAETDDVGVDDHGLWVELEMEFSAEAESESGGGYLRSTTGTPDPDTNSDGSVLLSDDALNRVAYELWEGEMFAQTLSTLDETLNRDDLAAFGVEELTLRTRAGLPPVFIENDGELEVQIGEFEVEMIMPGFEFGDHIVLRIAGSTDVDLIFDDGNIRPVLSNLDVNLDVVDTDWVQEQESIVNLMELILNPAMLLGAIEDVSIPIPSIDGLVIESAEIGRLQSGTHTSLGLNISPD